MRAGLSCTRRSAPLHEAANKGLCATQLFSFIGSVAEVNVSLGGKAYLLDIFTDIYNCSWSERDFEFVIQRADGETERYNDYMHVTDDGYGSFRHYCFGLVNTVVFTGAKCLLVSALLTSNMMVLK